MSILRDGPGKNEPFGVIICDHLYTEFMLCWTQTDHLQFHNALLEEKAWDCRGDFHVQDKLLSTAIPETPELLSALQRLELGQDLVSLNPSPNSTQS